MKLSAILLNIALIVTFCFMTAKFGLPKIDEREFLLFLLIFVTPLINLLYIFFSKGESWLALYFKRKAMEEKRKIEKLSSIE